MASQGSSTKWTDPAREDRATTRASPRGTRRPLPLPCEDARKLHHPHRPGRHCDAEPPGRLASDVPGTRAPQATGPSPPAGSEASLPHRLQPRHTSLHTGASRPIYTRTEARQRRTRQTLWPLKGKGWSARLTFESLLVTSVYKVFLFKSKWLQTSLAASGPWVTMAAIRFRQARAILFRDKKETRCVRTAETQSHPPRSSCTLGCVVCYPQTRKRKEGDMQTRSFFKKKPSGNLQRKLKI